LHVVGPLADDLSEQGREELERLGHLLLDRATERARLDEVAASVITKLRQIDAATWKGILGRLGEEQERCVAGAFGTVEATAEPEPPQGIADIDRIGVGSKVTAHIMQITRE